MIIEVNVSDPWEWVTDNGGGPFRGQVVAQGKDALLTRIEAPIKYADNLNEYVLATTRHAQDSFEGLIAGKQIPSNLLPIPEVAIGSLDAEVLEKALTYARGHRRGGLLGDISLHIH